MIARWNALAALAMAALLTMPQARADDGDTPRVAAPELSDKDKKLLAEIAQRPQIQAKIEDRWGSVRQADLREAYRLNTGYRPGQQSLERSDWQSLYDNPILQDYINALGQSLVPQDTPNVFAFRLVLDPMPEARALSTGSIYVSTGLVSLLDNEAQLAFVLAHEMAHVDRQHRYQQIRNAVLEEELAEVKEQNIEKKKRLFGAVGALAGAAIGKLAGNAGMGARIGLLAGGATAFLTSDGEFRGTAWDTLHEDEADEAAFRTLVARKFDPREVPKTYARLERLVSHDARIGLGFMGSPARVRERVAHARHLLNETLKVDIEGQSFLGSSPEFALLMSALKRDNGVIALDFDLFALARENLEDAAALRSNDPRVHYYLGKVLSLSGRNEDDRRGAVEHYLTAIRQDATRGNYPEPHLRRALDLIKQNRAELNGEIQAELKNYVTLYQRQNGGAVPPNMHIIYDYFLLAGDTSWYVPPAAVVQTYNVSWPREAPAMPPAQRKAAER